MNPVVSIIVPFYNAEKYLQAALDSVVGQTYVDFECICIDDGSTDGSAEIVERFVRNDNRFVLIRQTHGNAGLARNAGLKRARGEYVTFLDADDMFEPGGALAQAVVRMKRDRLDCLFCRAALTDAQDRNRGEAEGCFRRELIPHKEVFSPSEAGEGLFMMAGGMAWAKLFRREFVVRCGIRFADLSRSEDFVFVQLALAQADRLGALDRRLVRHRIDLPSSLETTKNAEPTQFWTADKQFYAELDRLDPSIAVRAAAAFASLSRWSYNLNAVSGSLAFERVFSLAPEIFSKTARFARGCSSARFRWAVRRVKKAVQAASALDFARGERKIFPSESPAPKHSRAFTFILPTYNRAFCICKAIDSLMRQTCDDWELVIADDGSTDGTEKLLQERYAAQFASGRFTYLRQENAGVCKARNLGLSVAQGDWIAYLDSDNTIRPDFLQTFSEAIRANPGVETFYSRFVSVNGGVEHGEAFDWDKLLLRNFIDLGVFVHRRCLVGEQGGFDETFRRLVDWELILRYTKRHPPVFVDRVLMDYNNSTDFVRITGSWLGNQDWKSAVMSKHGGHLPMVTTMVTAYNHRSYVAEAIESAMLQDGPFRREIIVADDGSTDGTDEIVAGYAKKYPHIIRNLSTGSNVGISANMRKCFTEARGDYVAVLEGDDLWRSRDKLARQLAFLQEHDSCPMVFSRIVVRDEDKKCERKLKIQDRLPPLLSGRDFFAAGASSVIINFSCCLFRRSALHDLPKCIWQPRLSEIALAFYLERRGPIGYIETPLSVYRVHTGSTWSGAAFLDRRRQEIACRETALKVCDERYTDDFRREIARIEEVVTLQTRSTSAKWRFFSPCWLLELCRRCRQCLKDNGWGYTIRHAAGKMRNRLPVAKE